MMKWLERAFSIKTRELPLVKAFFMFFCGIGMFYTVGATVGDTLFLASLSPEQVPTMLPWVYVGIAVGSFLVTMLYDAVQHRISRPAAIIGTQVFLAVTVLCFRLAIELGASWLYFGLAVWMEVSALLSITLYQHSFTEDVFRVAWGIGFSVSNSVDKERLSQ